MAGGKVTPGGVAANADSAAHAAGKTGVRFMTVIDRKEGIIYYWKPGMTDLEELGSLP